MSIKRKKQLVNHHIGLIGGSTAGQGPPNLMAPKRPTISIVLQKTNFRTNLPVHHSPGCDNVKGHSALGSLRPLSF